MKRIAGLSMILLLAACQPAKEVEIEAPVRQAASPRNVILMIGDGMGLAQVSAALYSNNNRLNLERFPVVGFHKSYSASDLITDSAAGATAFACGVKTYNNAIGLGPDTLPCVTILEEASLQGLATGIVVTSTVTHATPAAFVAHQPLRILYENIAVDIAESNIDLIIGGGKTYFYNRRMDRRNLLAEMSDRGFLILDNVPSPRSKIDASRRLAVFTAEDQPPHVNQGRDYLPYASLFAAEFLSKKSDKGFFLMIEGSQIDWAAHSNNERDMIKETLDFDRAVGMILDFARKRGDTLVIVTADHETGGASIVDGSKINRLDMKFTTNGHTASLVPVYAYGPDSESFSGIYENTAIYHKMKAALNLGAGRESTSIKGE